MPVCKYCLHDDMQSNNPIIFPCKCKEGVHLKCLGTWVFSSYNSTPRTCEVCLADYVGIDIPGIHIVSVDISGNPLIQDISGAMIPRRRRFMSHSRMLLMEGCCCCSFFVNIVSALVTGFSDDYNYVTGVRIAFYVTVILGVVTMICAMSCCLSRLIVAQRGIITSQHVSRRAIMPINHPPVSST